MASDSGRLLCPARPCPSCPYRRDVPSGVWHPEEYAKLALYDEQPGETPRLETFRCHWQTATGRSTVCVGWLGCHGLDAVAVRLALAMGALTMDVVERAVGTDVVLYESGTEAAVMGLRDINDPSPEAQAFIARLLFRGAARDDSDVAR